MTLNRNDEGELFLATQSEMGCWRRCRRKWWLTYYRRLRLKPQHATPNALSQGITFHDLMGARYTGGDWRAMVVEHEQRIRALADEGVPEDKIKKYLAQLELASIMVEGYEEWVEETGADADLEVVASEVRMEAPLAKHDGVQINALGKYDLLVRRHGILGFMDHKSAQSLDQWKIRLMNREQFRWYAALIDLAGSPMEAPRKAWLNVAKKVKRTARATPPFYDRYEVPINGHQIANVKIRAERMAAEMIDASRALDNGANHHAVVYPNPTGNCSWDCEFAAICPMFDDGSRAEAYVSDWYDATDPLERYERDIDEEKDGE